LENLLQEGRMPNHSQSAQTPAFCESDPANHPGLKAPVPLAADPVIQGPHGISRLLSANQICSRCFLEGHSPASCTNKIRCKKMQRSRSYHLQMQSSSRLETKINAINSPPCAGRFPPCYPDHHPSKPPRPPSSHPTRHISTHNLLHLTTRHGQLPHQPVPLPSRWYDR
jgi:hypothetical protein